MFDIRLLTKPVVATSNAQVPGILKKWETDRKDFEAINGTDPIATNLSMELGVACTVMPDEMRRDFLKELRSFSSYQAFKDRVLEYTDSMPGSALARHSGGGSAPMQLGAVAHNTPSGEDPLHGTDPWSLVAVGAGKAAGKGDGKC